VPPAGSKCGSKYWIQFRKKFIHYYVLGSQNLIKLIFIWTFLPGWTVSSYTTAVSNNVI
jgi:hypothetical protein